MTRPPARIAITLTGMRFHVRVGVLPHERELAQPLELDLTVELAAGSAAVLDYRTLYALTREVIEREPLEYL
jgi:dihydroneopterin aldolase